MCLSELTCCSELAIMYNSRYIPVLKCPGKAEVPFGNQNTKPSLKSIDLYHGLYTGQRGREGFNPSESTLLRLKRQRLCIKMQAAAFLSHGVGDIAAGSRPLT